MRAFCIRFTKLFSHLGYRQTKDVVILNEVKDLARSSARPGDGYNFDVSNDERQVGRAMDRGPIDDARRTARDPSTPAASAQDDEKTQATLGMRLEELMRTMEANRSRQPKRLPKTYVRKNVNFRNRLAAAQMTQAVRTLGAKGVLTGRTAKVSARVDQGLLAAAARILGSDNRTDIISAALAAFVAPDSLVDWFLSDRDRLPADFETAI